MEKKPYLVNQYLKKYLSASIATMAVLNINSMIDGMLMGRFIGPDALASINLALPLVNVIGAFTMLMGGGCSVVIARSLSSDNEKVNSSFMSALLTVIFIGVCIAASASFLIKPIASILCVTPELLEFTKQYISVILYGSVFLMINDVLMLLAEVGGSPQITTQCAVANCIANAVIDILLVGILHIGITGAAIATVISALCSILCSGTFFLSKKSPYRFNWKQLNFISSFIENVCNGAPNAIATVMNIIIISSCNYYVQLADGADGMFVMSIGITMINLSFILTEGSCSTFIAIGSMLRGRGDYKALQMLFQSCLCLVLTGPVVITVLNCFFSRQVAFLFGADSEQIFVLAAKNLPLISCFIWIICLNIFMATVYQVLEKSAICVPVMISSQILLCVFQLVISKFISIQYVWNAFWVTGLFSVFLTLFLTEFVRRKSDEKLKFLSLLPQDMEKGFCINASFPCTIDGISEEIAKLLELCEKAELGDLSNKIILCIEELSLNIVEHSDRNENKFIDVYIYIEEHEVKAFLQDNGIAFDPVSVAESKRNAGLKLVHNYCSNMSYDYLFGQNVTHMQWHR